MRLYIIRHADPDYENHTITPAGHSEARALAKRLSRMPVDRIYSSPLPRAVHTAQYTADALQRDILIEPWMAELDWRIPDRDSQSRAAWNVDGELLRREQPFPRPAEWHERPPFRDGGFQARYEALCASSDRFLQSLGFRREGGTYRIVRPSRESVAVFCHLGFGLTWLSHLLDLPLPLVWTGFSLAPSSVTTILMDERSSEWATPRCIGLGDTSHLYESELPISRQGIIANFD